MTSRRSAIRALLFLRCPDAICRRVRAVVIDALDRQFGWARTHVAKEGDEVVPLRRDRDAAAAVILKRWHVRILAARFHIRPNTVLARMASAMRAQAFAIRVRFQTTAGRGVPCFDVGLPSNNNGPAITATSPRRPFARRMRKHLQQCQTAIVLPRRHAGSSRHLRIIAARALNTANLSVKSLEKRCMEQAITDGVFAGAITGAPDA